MEYCISCTEGTNMYMVTYAAQQTNKQAAKIADSLCVKVGFLCLQTTLCQSPPPPSPPLPEGGPRMGGGGRWADPFLAYANSNSTHSLTFTHFSQCVPCVSVESFFELKKKYIPPPLSLFSNQCSLSNIIFLDKDCLFFYFL